MEAYKIDFVTNTLTITAAFDKAIQDVESEEYALYQRIIHDNPSLKVVRRTHKTPTKYNNKSGETTRCNQFKNLTYDRMERFIGGLSNSDEVMEAYNFIKDNASKVSTSPYAVVRKWFVKQFPLYRNNPIFYYHNEVEVIDFASFLAKLQEEKEA